MEGSHLQIVLKTGKNREKKKTKNNQKKIKRDGERMQGRFSSTDHGLFSFVVFLFPVLHLYFGLSSVLSNLHTNNQGKSSRKKTKK